MTSQTAAAATAVNDGAGDLICVDDDSDDTALWARTDLLRWTVGELAAIDVCRTLLDTHD